MHTVSSWKIQVVLHLHKDGASVIRDFDIGSCCVFWDGHDVFFNESGKLAYEVGANIVDVSFSRQPTYCHRLQKYIERGFAIAMPNVPTTANVQLDQWISFNSKNVALKLRTFAHVRIDSKLSESRLLHLEMFTGNSVDNNCPTDDADTSDESEHYYRSGIEYHNLEDLLLSNFRICRRRKSRRGLVGYVDAKDWKDFKSIAVRFDNVTQVLCKYLNYNFSRVSRWIGDSKLTFDLAALLLGTHETTTSVEKRIQEVVATEWSTVEWRYSFAAHNTRLTGTDLKQAQIGWYSKVNDGDKTHCQREEKKENI